MRTLAVAVLALVPALARGADLSLLVTDARGAPLGAAVAYLSGPGLAAPAAPPPVVVDQRDKQFDPRISVIATGTAVSFPNSDQIRHSVYSFSPAKTFSMKLYSGKPSAPVVFDRPGIVVLGCNIHDRMAAWVVVVDSPLYGRTDGTGHLTLHNTRPGDYELHLWYPGLADGGVTRHVSVGDKDPATLSVRLDVQPIGEDVP